MTDKVSTKPKELTLDYIVATKMILPSEVPDVEKAEMTHNLVNGMRDLVVVQEKNWLKLGMIWHFLTINKLWKYQGTHIHSASDFLKEIDLGVGRRSLEYYAKIVKSKLGDYIVEHSLVIPMTKLREISPLIKCDTDIELWVSKANALPYHALMDEVREAKGKIPTDACTHPANKLERWIRCSACGKWVSKQE